MVHAYDCGVFGLCCVVLLVYLCCLPGVVVFICLLMYLCWLSGVECCVGGCSYLFMLYSMDLVIGVWVL